MKQIYFATTNRGKVQSLKNGLKDYGIEVIHHRLELPEPRIDNLREIAKEKIWTAFNNLHKPCVVLDSGFYVSSLNGFPGSYVNYALNTIGIQGILKLVEGRSRECEFRNCFAYMDENMPNPAFFESVNRGEMSVEPRGEKKDYHWSDLFFIFEPEPEERRKTLAEMTDMEYFEWRKERQEHSYHTKFARWLNEQITL
ncbi:hypothetical protein HYT56_04830 [Candidatus Woesearchaeota archaeon]|nr:hypothetical protein [Candidatus Woesearchaeota archaeon]